MDKIITGLVKILSSQSSEYLDVGNPEFYPYSVPSDAEYNYVTLNSASAATWDTFSSERGYEVPVRLVVHTTEKTGGTKKSVEITNTIEDLLDKNHFDLSSGKIIYSKVEEKSIPMESAMEKGYFWQYIDLRVITERG